MVFWRWNKVIHLSLLQQQPRIPYVWVSRVLIWVASLQASSIPNLESTVKIDPRLIPPGSISSALPTFQSFGITLQAPGSKCMVPMIRENHCIIAFGLHRIECAVSSKLSPPCQLHGTHDAFWVITTHEASLPNELKLFPKEKKKKPKLQV